MLLSYPKELPFSEEANLEKLAFLLRNHQIIILSGETGSGKSTQLPKLCLALNLGGKKPIAHTQPRRIAATSVASRIAKECEVNLGEEVGYKIRFSSKVSDQRVNGVLKTKLILMTDGILLAELEQDPDLNRYDLIIIDEAHERSLNIDFLLGCLKNILKRRRDLKLVITSATLEVQKFVEFFTDKINKKTPPVFHIDGRTYPVEVLYRPLLLEDQRGGEGLSLPEGVLKAIEEIDYLNPYGRGDILVFLPTERDIYDAEAYLEKAKLFHTEIFLLFARLSNAQQQKIFETRDSHQRRIILATNIAETSVTVPNIFYVIDSGLARIKRYSPRSKVERLPIEPISKASADQRKGRCGRIGPGVCVRLYSQEEYDARENYTQPELLRSNLAAVILKMKILKLGPIENFNFIDRPESNLIKDGFLLLEELQALEKNKANQADHTDFKLSSIGRAMARYPLDPRLSRMLIAGVEYKILKYILPIIAGLATQDPRLRPMDCQTQADQQHQKYRHPRSDFLSFLVLYKFLEKNKLEKSKKEFAEYLKINFISPTRYREWLSVYQELKTIVASPGSNLDLNLDLDLDLDLDLSEKNLDRQGLLIHRAILTGILSHIGHMSFSPADSLKQNSGLQTKSKTHTHAKTKTPAKSYDGARGIKFELFPGSVFGKRTPAWIMGYELVETRKVFARLVAEINPEEIERAARHLVKREYFEPRWISKGFVGAFEKISLYGLEIMPKRPVNFSQIDVKTAREFFIWGALVHQETEEKLDFLEANLNLKEELEDFEHQQRVSGLMVSESNCFEFFNALVPLDIADMPKFKRWYLGLDPTRQRAFFYTREFLLAYEPQSENLYPAHLIFSSALQLALTYHFEPGAIDDGVTLEIPIALLHQVNFDQTSYLVLPLLKEKCEFLIKNLPKKFRLACSPVSEYAQVIFDLILEKSPQQKMTLSVFMAQELSRITGLEIYSELFKEGVSGEYPAYLNMNYRLLDKTGEIISESRDAKKILDQDLFLDASKQAVQKIFSDLLENKKLNYTTWSFGELKPSVELEKSGVKYWAYPALIDHKTYVRLEVLSSEIEAKKETPKGLLRLFLLALPKEAGYLIKKLEGLEKLRQHLIFFDSEQVDNYLLEFVERVFSDVFEIAYLDLIPKNQAEFEQKIAEKKGELNLIGGQIVYLLNLIFDRYFTIQTMLSRPKIRLDRGALEDIETQLDYLFYEGFIKHTPEVWLKRYPVYLEAILYRLEKYHREKDDSLLAELNQVWWPYLANEDLKLTSEVHYWIEELRVSLFAQGLKTKGPVSVKRILREFIQYTRLE